MIPHGDMQVSMTKAVNGKQWKNSNEKKAYLQKLQYELQESGIS